MTIRQKIRISNILMILIPIIFTAAVIAVCLNTSLGSYWHTLESMYADENGIQFAQSMIYNYQQELWEYNWEDGWQEDGTWALNPNAEMTDLENELSGMGYRFMITKNGKMIYSNLTEEDVRIGREVAGEAIDSAKTLTASRYEVSVIKNTFWHGEKVFCITAIHPGKTDGGAVNYLKNYILNYVFGIIVFFVALAVLANGILSWWISKSILRPLGLLSLGTREIREGNLDTRMEYDKKDEFGEVCRDFDEMRAYLQESVRQRLKDEERRRELITGISHDLRTPLTTMSGYLDGLLEGIADTPEKRKHYLLAIRTRTESLVSLVDSLSEYSRLGGDFRYYVENTDMKEYAQEYIEACKADMAQNGTKIRIVCREEERYPVMLDKKEFKRVFDNLFSNTIKYREKDSSFVTISLKKIPWELQMELTFQDDGPGVPKESLEQIFDSFYRVDDSRSRAETGSGIGLAVVREIILGHGGNVRAENRGGLAIIICLPLNPHQEEGR